MQLEQQKPEQNAADFKKAAAVHQALNRPSTFQLQDLLPANFRANLILKSGPIAGLGGWDLYLCLGLRLSPSVSRLRVKVEFHLWLRVARASVWKGVEPYLK